MYHLVRVIAPIVLLIVLAVNCSKQNEDVKTTGDHTAAEATESNSSNIARGSVVNGSVIFEGDAPQMRRLMVVKDTEVCGRGEQYDKRLILCEDKRGIQNAVVYLTAINGGKPLSSLGNEFVIDQQGCRYEPHVLLVPVNTRLQILNNDGILHNFHTFCKKNRPCNVSQPKFRKKMELTFEHPEFIQARCDIHGWMSCWIIVVDHPYYAITDADGNFSLTDVPPGTYELNCWQEILGEQTIQITIPPGSEVSTSFSFSGKGA